MAAALDETARAIGALESAVAALENSVTGLRAQWGEQDRNASDSRRSLHQSIDKLRVDVTSLQGDVVATNRKVDALAPIVKAGERWHLEHGGIKKLLGLLWQVLYALICAVGGAFVMRWHSGGGHGAP